MAIELRLPSAGGVTMDFQIITQYLFLSTLFQIYLDDKIMYFKGLHGANI